MSDFEKEDLDCIEIQKNHGPGGELPTISLGGEKKPARKESRTKEEAVPDAQWNPVLTASADIAPVVRMVLAIAPYALMIGVLFWWQMSGWLDEKIGFYAMIVLALITGISAGKSIYKKSEVG